MKDYDSEVRPVQNYADVMMLKFEVAVQQIVEVVSDTSIFELQ